MMLYPHIAARAFMKPLLLEPRAGLSFLTTLAGLLARADLADRRPRPMAFDDDREPPPRLASLPLGLTRWDAGKAFPQVANVAVIEVDGTLVNKNGALGPDCGMTGYDGIRTQFTAALQDPAVAGIAFYIESPGGEVAGCFDLAEFVLEARGTKPVLALVDGMAASAAYALASACDRIACSSVGLVGSIGVIVAHADFSKMLEKDGVNVSLIFAGARKADGNPFNPLPAAVRASIQAEIDAVWEQFAELVARGRGLTPQAVKKLEADSFLAAEGAKKGLVDVVMSPADALAQFIKNLSS
jgi:signal peptide peptidase SppA